MPKNRKLVRRLHNVRIDEVSAVDKGAGEGCQIKLMKRASNAAFAKATARLAMSVKSIVEDPNCDKNAMLAKTFSQFQDHLNTLMKRYPKNANLDVSVGEADPEDGMPDDATRTERLSDDADADDDEKEKEAMTAKLKSLDAVQICKQMVDEGDAHSMSEHDLVSLVDNFAKAHDTTFVALYERGDHVGLAIRKAITIAKNAQFASRLTSVSKQSSSTPFHAGGEGYFGPAGEIGRASLKPRLGNPESVNNPKSALAAVEELVAAQRAANKNLTEAGAWAAVYASTDPETRRAVEAERLENRPVAGQ
jgi:hypothetical protein